MPSRALAAVAALAAALGSAGCVERSLLVVSDPPGARLTVNGVNQGVTPRVIRYVHDGRFDVRLEKEGYESVATEVTTRTRLDAVPGPDFIAENVWPGRIRRQTVAHLRMTPLKRDSYTKEEVQALLRRAEAFRQKAQQARTEPGTPRPGPAGPAPRVPVDPFPSREPAVR
jgi:hypothetical protein